MTKMILAALLVSACARAQSASGGQFQQSGVSGQYLIATPPSFNGLQGPTTVLVCAKGDVESKFMATFTYETANGSQEVTIRLKGYAPTPVVSCGLAITPGLQRMITLSVLPFDPSKELSIPLDR